jgi:hypothetical protein
MGEASVDLGPERKDATSVDPEQWEAILGNPAIENRAVEFVIEMERQEGRSARDTRGRGAGDVESEGRVIEVKGFSRYGLRSARVLYFTSPQMREGQRNENYYVYVVENVAQGDPSKFEVRVLHGEDLRRLFTEAKVHRFYVPVRAADYARLWRLDKGSDEPADLRERVRKTLTPGQNEKRVNRNAALRAWRHENREHVSRYMKEWRAKRKGP